MILYLVLQTICCNSVAIGSLMALSKWHQHTFVMWIYYSCVNRYFCLFTRLCLITRQNGKKLQVFVAKTAINVNKFESGKINTGLWKGLLENRCCLPWSQTWILFPPSVRIWQKVQDFKLMTALFCMHSHQNALSFIPATDVRNAFKTLSSIKGFWGRHLHKQPRGWCTQSRHQQFGKGLA